MQSTDDNSLLRDYVENHSDEAFTALVAKYVNLVYSVAMRSIGNPNVAQEITQAVFIILARKAGQLRNDKALSSWLFKTTQLTANNFLRSELRRQSREQEAYDMQTILNESDMELWPKIAPLLDSAVAALKEKDRRAILLRFYEGKNLLEIGATLGVSEAAVEKRVSRAVGKLQKFFFKRGVTSTAKAITATISANSVQAVPAGLAKTISAVAIAKGATASGSTLALVKGALKIMTWTKAKTAVVIGASALLVAGTTTVTVKKIAAHHFDESWRTQSIESSQIDKLPPQVAILPTKFSSSAGSKLLRPGVGIDKFVGINVPVSAIASLAYRGEDPLGLPWPRERMIFTTPEPGQHYDFVATLSRGSQDALRQELKTQLGFVGHYETRDTSALLLKVKNPNASQLIPSSGAGFGDFNDNIENGEHHFKCENQPLSIVAGNLERQFRKPVIDQTGLTQHFNIDLRWNEQEGGMDALKEALLDQLGLELVSATAPVEMLVIEKSN